MAISYFSSFAALPLFFLSLFLFAGLPLNLQIDRSGIWCLDMRVAFWAIDFAIDGTLRLFCG